MFLEDYKGSYPTPADFNDYWDEQIKFIENVPLKYNLEKVEEYNFSNIEYFHLTFESFDGAKIYSKLIKPKNSGKLPAMFYFHGYPGCNRNWFEKSAFCSLGYVLFAMDFRGQGGKSEDIGGIKGTTVAGHIVAGLDDSLDNMLYRKNILDVCLLIRIAKDLDFIDANNLNCAGGSQGGAFSTICAGLNPDIKKCIIQYPFLSDMKKVYDMDLDLVAYEGLRYYARWFNTTGEEDEKFFTRLAYIDTKNFAPRIKADVLFAASKIDLVCPIATQYAVYNNINSKKELILYKKFAHESMPDFNDKMLEFLLASNKEVKDAITI